MAKTYFSTNTTGTHTDEMMGKSRSMMDQLSDTSPMPKKDGIDTWRYPIYIDNMNEDNDAPRVMECIHFTAMKQGGVSFEDTALDSAALAAMADQKDNTLAKMTSDRGLSDSALRSAIGGTGNSGSYNWATDQEPTVKKLREAWAADNGYSTANGEKSNTDTIFDKAVQGVTILGKIVKSQHKNVTAAEKPLAHCFLYMPSSVQEGLGASWGAESLGPAGQGVKGLIKNGKIDDIMRNFAGGSVEALGKAVAITGGAAAGAWLAKNAVLGAIGAAGVLGGIGTGFQSAARLTTNPFEEQIFNGIGYREFTFDFVFQPSSEAEGIQIAEIIKMFRLNSRPNFARGPFGEGLYTFPNEFAVEFMTSTGIGGEFIRNKNLPKMYNCVCTNVQTNFTPEGFWSSLKGGTPIAYALNLSFVETKKITQEDIKKEY